MTSPPLPFCIQHSAFSILQFALDRARGMVVRLPNGAQLSGDLGTARDELAAFVTKGAKTDYASLDDAEKGKVHVLMALLNQKTAMAPMNAEPLALDPHGRDYQLTVAGEPNREFEISFAKDGSLKVDCKYMMAGNLYVRDFASWENDDNI